ncbi:MAG: hypothetical protein MUP22_11295 [Desulfobacterales bacterium]|nr:hypothetical protein [Desulfobacterales bacterium]
MTKTQENTNPKHSKYIMTLITEKSLSFYCSMVYEAARYEITHSEITLHGCYFGSTNFASI